MQRLTPTTDPYIPARTDDFPPPGPAAQSPRASIFQGIWVPLITPFLDGAIDRLALRRLVRHYRDAGVHGLVACGTTAEAAALDVSEQAAVLDLVLEEAADTPVLMGLSDGSQRDMLARAARWTQRPVAGLLAAAPAYIRPSQQGLHAHFEALADAARKPLAIYDIPYRTGVQISLPTLLALAAHPNIAAIKDCGGDVSKTTALIADRRLAVLAGEDMQALTTLCLGGSGIIAASAHIRPDLFVAMFHAVKAQRLHEARAIFHALAPVIGLLYADPNPGPVKAALARLHGFSGALRPPMTRAPVLLEERLAAVIAALPAGWHGAPDTIGAV